MSGPDGLHWSPQYGQSCGPALLTFHESDARRIPARWRPVHIAWWCTRALAVISAHRYLRIMLHRTEPRAVCTSCFTAGWPSSQDGARADSATQYTLPGALYPCASRAQEVPTHGLSGRPLKTRYLYRGATPAGDRYVVTTTQRHCRDLRYSFSYLAHGARTHARARGRGERGRRARRQTHPGRGAATP